MLRVCVVILAILTTERLSQAVLGICFGLWLFGILTESHLTDSDLLTNSSSSLMMKHQL